MSVDGCIHGCSQSADCSPSGVLSRDHTPELHPSASPLPALSIVAEDSDRNLVAPPFPEHTDDPDHLDVWQDEMLGYQQLSMERFINEVRTPVHVF